MTSLKHSGNVWLGLDYRGVAELAGLTFATEDLPGPIRNIRGAAYRSTTPRRVTTRSAAHHPGLPAHAGLPTTQTVCRTRCAPR